MKHGIDFKMSPKDCDESQVDNLMFAIETCQPETVAEQFVRMGFEFQEAEDRIYELERDGQLALDAMRDSCRKQTRRLICFNVASGLLAAGLLIARFF